MVDHPPDSIADVSARLALWAEDEGGGLGRVEFVDERARLAVMAFLRRELENKGHKVCEIRCPGVLPPNQLAQWLVEELGKLDQPATLISIENLAAAVEERDLHPLLAALNFRREQLDPRWSRQIWWVPNHLATIFARLIPDLDSFFQLKLRLRESSWEPLPNLLFSNLAEAEPLMRRALEIDETSFGPDHPNVAVDLNNLALLLKDMHRFAEAELLMRRALAIDETSFGPDHPKVTHDLNNLANMLQDMNRLAEAEPLIRRALAIDETSFGPEHPKVAVGLNNLAQLLKATNRLAEAEPLLRRALAILERSLGPDHPQTLLVRRNWDDMDQQKTSEASGPAG